MSTSSAFSDSGDFSGKSSSEKTTGFSQTCNKFSQYMKERLSLDVLGLCMETTGSADILRLTAAPINFFPVHNHHPMNFLPQQTGPAQEAVHMPANPSLSKSYVKEPETAPMTIFYAGQVIVFNDFPAKKAKEVMQMASQASSHIQSPNTVASTLPMSQNGCAHGQNQVSSGYRIPPSPSFTSSSGMNMAQDHVLLPKEPIELPIARKNSLQRFLERRKERISARVPYFAVRKDAISSDQAEKKSWLSLAAQTS